MNEQGQKQNWMAYDPWLLLSVLLLTGIGVVMVYSASSELALRQYGTEYYFFIRQLIFAGIGITAMIAAMFVPYKLYRLLAYVLLIIALGLLTLVLLEGFGHSAGGAMRWLRLKWVSFQPAELARFALIVYMAYSLTKKQDLVERFWVGFMPHVFLLLVFTALLYLEPDFGTIAIFWMLAWIIMYSGRVRLRHLISALIPILPVAVYLLFSAEYRLKRAMSFLDPWKYPLDEGYQIIHSLMAFGSGGVLGKGFGQGYQKLFYLPTPHTDFIFSVIGEEGGLIWVLIVIGLFVLLLWRGLIIARSARDNFASLLAFGITASISLQAIVNMGVDLSLLPTKGLTLPFLSYGGTSLVFNLVCVGILININRLEKYKVRAARR